MSLSDWARDGRLTRLPTSRAEIAELLQVADRDLADAGAGGMSLDWQFGIAYNGALKLCTILLRSEGFRAAKGSHHHNTIAAMPLMLGAERRRDATYLDRCREKRNTAEYDRVGTITEVEVQALLAFAQELRAAVLAWLNERHPDLLS